MKYLLLKHLVAFENFVLYSKEAGPFPNSRTVWNDIVMIITSEITYKQSFVRKLMKKMQMKKKQISCILNGFVSSYVSLLLKIRNF